MDYLKNNDSIFVFMGFKTAPGNEFSANLPMYLISKTNGIVSHTCSDGSLMMKSHNSTIPPEYHLHWDWLMPVVKKITDRNMSLRGNEFDHKLRILKINNSYQSIITNLHLVDIEKTYTDVVEYIKHFNINENK